MPPKNPPTVRQWKLIEILKKSKRGLTLVEIADRLGMDARTIRRDLAKPPQTVCEKSVSNSAANSA